MKSKSVAGWTKGGAVEVGRSSDPSPRESGKMDAKPNGLSSVLVEPVAKMADAHKIVCSAGDNMFPKFPAEFAKITSWTALTASAAGTRAVALG